MKKLIRRTLLACMALVAGTAAAQVQTMTVHLNDGTQQTFPVMTVDSVTFAEGEDAVSLELRLDELNGTKLTYTIVPEDETKTYYTNYLSKASYDEAGSDEAVFEQQMESEKESAQFLGMTFEEYLAQQLETGTQSFTLSLSPQTTYYLTACYLNASGEREGEFVKLEVTTGDVAASDNQITIEVLSVKTTSATISTTTTNDDTYKIAPIKTSELGKTTEEIHAQLKSKGARLSGGSQIEMSPLDPGTEYVVVAMGDTNGYPTTEPFYSETFTTPEKTENNIEVSLEYDKYFDGSELAALYPDYFSDAAGYAVLPVKPSVSGPVANFYYGAYIGDYMDDYFYDDDYLISELTYDGAQGSETYFFGLPYDEASTLLAVGEDADGNFTKVWRELVTLTQDGVSPTSEFSYLVSSAAAPYKRAPKFIKLK